MNQDKEYLTKEKFEELTNELNELKTVTRKKVAEQLEYAKGLGDLSENAEYHEAREDQAKVESRIIQLENLLKNTEIVSHKKGDVVEVGSTVEIKKSNSDNSSVYTLVSVEEADVSLGKLSYKSPLGESLLGKKKGDFFDFQTPKGKVKYSIISVK